MSEEITLDDILWQLEKHPIDSDYVFGCKEVKIIYDSIIKLKKENERLQQESKQLKEELQQFQYDFEKQEAEVFNELEQAINELDLSDKTKEYLIDIMNKDVNIVFGIVEDKIQELKEKYKC